MLRREFFKRVGVALAAAITPAVAAPVYGVSKLSSAYRSFWYVQILRRYNETLATDYMIPFRTTEELERYRPKG